ncbi:MAG: hypothetical protein WCK01_03855 [Candidatus Uhrbacteria bacterium]
MPDGVVEYLSSQINPALLGNNRLQRLVARTASAMFGLGDAGQEVAEAVIMDFFETLAERSKNLTDEDEEEEMADDKKKADDKKASKDAKPAAKEAPPPKPPEKTLLQVVGELDAALQTKFWKMVGLVTIGFGTQSEKDAFLARVKHVTLSKEEVTAILHNADEPLCSDMLKQAVQHALNAGGMKGGFRSIMDSASDRLSSLIGGSHQPSNLGAELDVVNANLLAEREIRKGFR